MSPHLPFPAERIAVVSITRHGIALAGHVVAALPAGPADEALRMTLDRAIAGLTGDLKMAFTLVDVLGFSREEAAQLAGVPGNTMRARAARARVVLASMLTEGDES